MFPAMDATAKWLLREAQAVVDETLRLLPPDLSELAATVTVIYEPVPGPALIEEGWQPDLLGMFSGQALGDPLDSGVPLPPQILLFYENLWDFAEGDEETYREEVKITYLHELGHCLGLDEDEIEARGLL
jgi:predicted Zn-dependent protease with MMP-like domain